MSSRSKILQAVKKNQPEALALPQLQAFAQPFQNAQEKFITVLQGIGGEVHEVTDYESIAGILQKSFGDAKRVVSTVPALHAIAEKETLYDVAHHLKTVDLAVLQSHLAVAENGAVWITDAHLPQRVLPFITQHLAVVVDANAIVPTLHEAYEKIGDGDYGFGVFIAGPSKTADIEQSLVLGAHGPKTMTVFLLPS
jgi:L-lactate dehydrogenase complex protein LldG